METQLDEDVDVDVGPILNLIDNIEKDINISNLSSNKFADFIVDLVKDFYDNAITKSNKPGVNEWTVFSSIILQNNDQFKVITFSNGTKSLPIKNLKDTNSQILDCHAEIISMRAFKLFLIKCLIFNLINKSLNFQQVTEFPTNFINFLTKEEFNNFKTHEQFFDIFEFTTTKIKLKSNIYFHLYISEFPCGDCSLFPVVFNDKLENNQTGSKTIKEVLNYLNVNNNLKFTKLIHDNSLGQFRSKSMRNDITKDNISFSLSCTDKILFKNIFGMQGKYLSNIIDAIYFSTIIISNNNTDLELSKNENIIKTVNRGISLIRRVDYITELKKMFTCPCNKNSFIFNEPKVMITNSNITQLINKSEKNAVSFSAYWYYSKDNFYKIDPVTGYKQGANLNCVNKDKIRSEISKVDVFRNYIKILEIYSSEALIGNSGGNFNNLNNLDNLNRSLNKNFTNSIFNKLIKEINSNILNFTQTEHNNKGIPIEQLMTITKNSNYISLKQKLKEILNLQEFLNKKLNTN